MSDQERNDEGITKDYYEYKSTMPNDNDKSNSSPSAKIGKSKEENLSESARVSNNVRTVILGLFALIGFIVLVFAVFTASVGAQLNQVQFANSVFIAAIVGAFTLVGVIVYQIRGGNGR